MHLKLNSYCPEGSGRIHVLSKPEPALEESALSWQGERFFLLIDSNVLKFHPLPEILAGAADTLVLPRGGEWIKTQATLNKILTWLNHRGARRGDWLVALGGGALTDVAGFAASIYMRGMPLVLVPTTLLAQVDGAVGGKNGINAFGLKNALGSFWFPRQVICAANYLDSLSFRQFNSGLGEVWKYRLLAAETDWLGLQPLTRRGLSQDLVFQCIAYKNKVVTRDPLDREYRHSLNLGHTLAHALEGMLPILHGEAVLWGLEFALLVARQAGVCPEEPALSALQALRQQPRPRLPELKFANIYSLMEGDKKNLQPRRITFVLPAPGGLTVCRNITRKELEECWQIFQQSQPRSGVGLQPGAV